MQTSILPLEGLMTGAAQDQIRLELQVADSREARGIEAALEQAGGQMIETTGEGRPDIAPLIIVVGAIAAVTVAADVVMRIRAKHNVPAGHRCPERQGEGHEELRPQGRADHRDQLRQPEGGDPRRPRRARRRQAHGDRAEVGLGRRQGSGRRRRREDRSTASTWKNLLPSCIDWNRRRRQTDALTGTTRLAGKADQFPIAPGTKRAAGPGDERSEVPLLLDPCVDEPAEYLRCTPEAVFRPRQLTGLPEQRDRASIDVYALNRSALVLARKEHLRTITLRIGRIRAVVRLLEESLPDRVQLVLEGLLLADLRELARMRRADQANALQARQLIDRWMDDLVSRRVSESAFAAPDVPGRAG